MSAFNPRLCCMSALLLGWLVVCVSPAAGQTPAPTGDDPPLLSIGKLVAGAASALAMHEAGHLVFDVIFDASPGIKKVSYAGIPFFAITHEPVSPVQEFAISSAGFWVQHATSEWLLTARPHLRQEHAPFAKGVLAFNVLTSVMYAGAAMARTGPLERDTRGIALSAGIAEPWVGALVLAPAALDAVRYVRPEWRSARWASRAAKVAGVVLIVKAATR
jgi:hypothetical protein